MKCIGFIKDYDQNIPNAKPLSEATASDQFPTEPSVMKRVIEYLEHGVFLTGAMSNVYDLKSGELIGNADYFTDGFYIWPNYFSYFLRKYPHMDVDEEFIDYLFSKNFSIEQIPAPQLLALERYFDEVWSKQPK